MTMTFKPIFPLVFLLATSGLSSAWADATVLRSFKMPSSGSYTVEGTMAVAGQPAQVIPLSEHCAGGADPAATAKAMAQFEALGKSLNQGCKSTVLEDTAARATVQTVCAAGHGTRMLLERIDANTFRTTTTVQVAGSSVDHSKSVTTQRFTGKPCAAPTASGPAMPTMPKADAAKCAEGKAAIAEMRSNPHLPAGMLEQVQAALKMQGCAL